MGRTVKKFISDDEMNTMAPKKFISDEEMEVHEPKATSSEKNQAALQGFGQAGTFGYLPNIQAAAEPLTDKIFGLLPGNKPVDDDRSYVQRRDSNIVRDKSLQEKAPAQYLGGQIAGSIVTPTPGSGLIKGAGIASKIGRAALGGAEAAALYNPGEKTGEISGPQIGERLKNAGTGLLVGGGSQTVASIGGKALGAWANKSGKLKNVADMLTLDSLGTKKKFAKKLIENDKIEDVAGFARDKNIISGGESFDQAYKKAVSYKDTVGKEIGDTYKAIDSELKNPSVMQKANPEHIMKYMETEVAPDQLGKRFLVQEMEHLKGTSAAKQTIGKLQTELENLSEVPNDVPSLLKYRRSLDKTIKNWGRESSGSEDSLKRLRSYIKDHLDERIDALDKIVGSDKVNHLKKINKEFSLASDVESILQDKMESEISNRYMGLIPAIVGTGGGIIGAGSAIAQGEDAPSVIKRGLLGAATGLAYKKGRDYLPAIGAKTLGGMSKLLEKDPTAKLAGKARGLLDKVDPQHLGSIIERVRK